jgi:hypothetical protein
MNREAPVPETLSKHLPATRIKYYAAADESVIQTIRCGILFVMAWWSGPARRAYIDLAEVLSKLDAAGRLEFVVVDTDGVPALYERAEFIGRMTGSGETAWIKDGRIVTTSGLGFNPDCFETNTKTLLAMCTERD